MKSCLKLALLGAALAVQLFPGAAQALTQCVYVIGEVTGRAVAVPAVPIFVPGRTVEVQPVRVHVDPHSYEILGYTVATPELDMGTEGQQVIVAGLDTGTPGYRATLSGLHFQESACLHYGVSTPAIPIYIPEVVLTTPAASVPVPLIEFNILGQQISAGGQLIHLQSLRIIFPGYTLIIPQVTVASPEPPIIIHINGRAEEIDFLLPPY